jgi:tRNA-uridine 2-sulfurtransferase
MGQKVVIGMSGGVDSTVSTLLLKEQGYEVEGVYMKLHSKPGYHEIHQERAQKAADFAGVKLHILDLQEKFNEKVFTPFIETYKEGKTPNPCALCNRNIKFGAMVEFADSLGADFIATGHYIRHNGQYLQMAEDDTKDQSYFLFYIDPALVPRLLFPLGEKHKTDIKAYAAGISGLESFASQGESSEICFVETTYAEVLKPYVNVDVEGDVLNLEGKVVGKHKGYMHYTIGKRKGFSVHGAHDPHFVVEIRPDTNQIVVGPREALECHRVVLENVNMFDNRVSFECDVKLRYRTTAVRCNVVIDGNHATVELYEPVLGVASGQAGVFYDGDTLLGGGWII